MAQNFSDFTTGVLRAQLDTLTTTGVTVKLKKVNDAYPTWPTGVHQIMIVQKTRTQTKVEKCDVAAATSQDSDGIVTLGTLTRKISLKDGTDVAGTGTAQSFTQGADVFIAWTTTDAEQTVKKNEANTLTGSGSITSSSTTTAVVGFNSVTTAQRTAMSPSNGWVVYDSDLDALYQYIGGAWEEIENATAQSQVKVSTNDTTPGTLTEKMSGGDGVSLTETGDGGDEDLAVAVDLDSDPGLEFNSNALRVKVKAAGGVTRDSDGLSVDTSGLGIGVYYAQLMYAGASDSAEIGASSTTIAAFDTHSYNVPADDLIASVIYEVEGAIEVDAPGGAATFHATLMLGNVEMADVGVTVNAQNDNLLIFRGVVRGTAASGASVSVRSEVSGMVVRANGGANDDYGAGYDADNVATNAQQTLQIGGRFTTSDAAHGARLVSLSITKKSTTAF